MFSRPFRMLGRSVLAAGIISMGAASLGAQSAPASTAPPAGPNPSRVDIFLGYSYYGAHGVVKPANIRYSSIDLGAIGSAALYFNKYFGAEISLSAHPDGQNDGLYIASAGPIFRAPMQNFTLFAHAHAGAAKLGGPNQSNSNFNYHNPYTIGPALKVGGGMDYDLPFADHMFGIRLFQADYTWEHVNFGYYTPPPTQGVMGGRANLPGVELSSGILLHFGHIIPPPPVMYSCVASPATVYPGDPVTVTGTATNLNPKKTATYSWTTDGGVVSGTSSTANVDTNGLAPGSYTVKGHVSESTKAGRFADCSAPFTVKAFEPPTITCSASPSSVKPGESATITSVGNSPQNRPLTYSYSASSGSVSGSGTTATLSTTAADSGTVTVTCNVVDDKGQTASATTTVSVSAPPPPPAPSTSSLCSAAFDRDKRRPTRVDNEAKACLDDVALSLQRDPSSKIVLTGNSDSKRWADKQAAERAINTKEYLVKDKGVDPSRVVLYTGNDGSNNVTTTLVPSGATMPTGTPVDETVKPVRHGRHHRR